MRPSSAKSKGRKLQQWMRDRIIERFKLPADDVRSCSMGACGEDIQLSVAAKAKFPYAVECKNVEKVNVWAAYAQADKYRAKGEPLVCIKRNSGPALVVVDADHFLDLAARALPPPPEHTPMTPPPMAASKFLAELEGSENSWIDAFVSEDCVHRAQTP